MGWVKGLGAREGTEPTKTLRHRRRTGTAAYRQAGLAVQVLPSPLGLCHRKASVQREASATWNKQGSWPSEDGAKRLLGPPFLCRSRGLVRVKAEKKAQRQGTALGRFISAGRKGALSHGWDRKGHGFTGLWRNFKPRHGP